MRNKPIEYGVVLGKPTGRVSDQDSQYIEVELPDDLVVYARPCYSFGHVYAPTPEWLAKYKDEIMIWLSFEEGRLENPVWLGYTFIDGKGTDLDIYPNGAIFRTREFFVTYNDSTKTYTLQIRGTNQKLEIKEGQITIASDAATLEAGNQAKVRGKTVLVEADQRISLGASASQHAVLGETLNTNLQELITEVSKLASTLQTFATTQSSIASSPAVAPGAGGAAYGPGFVTLNGQLSAQIPVINALVSKLTSQLSTKVQVE